MTAPALVRPGRLDDVAGLAAVERAAGEPFRTVGLAAVADDDPPPPTTYRAAVVDGRLWVATVADALVGYAYALDLDGQPHLEQISVRPEAWGHGIGTGLVDAVAEWARPRGPTLTLSTFRDVPWNGPWYARRGFTVVAPADHGPRFTALRRHEADLGLDVAARVIMVRDLARPAADLPG